MSLPPWHVSTITSLFKFALPGLSQTMTSHPPVATFLSGGWSLEDAVDYSKKAGSEAFGQAKSAAIWGWGKTTRRMRIVGGFILFMAISLSLWRPDKQYEIPKVTLEYSAQSSPYNASKVALLIENRPNPILAPLMLHFMSVVPPDWRFRFMGSPESVASINSSYSIRNQVAIGKLDLTFIPTNMTTGSQEEISRFLTNLWIYEVVLQPAEWLLVFQTDSILCANSRQSINNFLEYDWVGAPWNPNGRFGGNGGLSLRRVSAIVDILRNQVRKENDGPEDVWLTERLGHRPGAHLANGTASLTFSGEMFSGETEKIEHSKGNGDRKKKPTGGGIDSVAEDEGWMEGIDDWRDGFYEPMGYHTGGSGTMLHGGIWGSPDMRKHIWDYCPEVKMTFAMDAAEYVPGECNSNWKRDGVKFDWRNEVDENGYPYLPLNLVPW